MKIIPHVHGAEYAEIMTGNMPDGQPHVHVPKLNNISGVTLRGPLRNSDDIMNLLLTVETLRHQHENLKINFVCTYLLGARMDRRIDEEHPFTLATIASLINSCNFNEVGIIDPHSPVSTNLIARSHAILPFMAVQEAIEESEADCVVAPDQGAWDRVVQVAYKKPIVRCSKHRDSATGKLSAFTVHDWPDYRCLIIDDICDGGKTFTGIAAALREKGAEWVGLFVTHGIFSKGLPIEGIDQIWTTDSYYDGTLKLADGHKTLPAHYRTVLPLM